MDNGIVMKPGLRRLALTAPVTVLVLLLAVIARHQSGGGMQSQFH
jgi:hypothetical protein